MKDYSCYHNVALKLLNKNSFYEDLYALFCKELTLFDPTCEELAKSFASYFFLEEAKLEKKEAIEVSTRLFALITSDFNDDMDFSLEQWDFIRDLTFTYQGELSIELLNTIVDVLMTRKKLVF